MTKESYLLRHFLIIHKLRQSGEATFDEIQDYLREESNFYEYNDLTISKRTFERDRNEISTLFHLDIEYDSRYQVYRLFSQTDEEIKKQYIEAFDLFNSLNVLRGISYKIYFEKRRSAGVENLYPLFHAIKNYLVITFSYDDFWENNYTNRVIRPYYIKDFKGKWYVVGRDEENSEIKSYGLDRIRDIHITNDDFIPFPIPAIKNHLSESYGIDNSDDEYAQNIEFTIDLDSGKYLKSYPLHETQKIIFENEYEMIFLLKVKINKDLVKELLSYGESLTVLRPNSLKELMVKSLRGALTNYE